ncbi:hypothetical protein [Nostoc sp. ChiQUE01b]|uniref:hypothetical protein n=1 Tax=Nostoc sp. ChiQUE01b TaxID=3075376 RepID=UPI002AD215B5|nr:hypothetical protein [Nostoc sp. ChiQUE01b]MDZ8257876.1 hypothetical protein [Nostoc sp. ChiQUE01b]
MNHQGYISLFLSLILKTISIVIISNITVRTMRAIAQQTPIARITNIEGGKVWVVKNSSKSKEANLGDNLFIGDMLRLISGTKVVVKCRDGKEYRVDNVLLWSTSICRQPEILGSDLNKLRENFKENPYVLIVTDGDEKILNRIRDVPGLEDAQFAKTRKGWNYVYIRAYPNSNEAESMRNSLKKQGIRARLVYAPKDL